MCHYYFMRLPAYQWVSLCYSTFVKTNIEAKGTKTNSKSKELKLIVFFILIWKLAYTHISKSSCLRAGFFVDECKFHNFSHSFSLFLIFYSHSFPIFPIIKSTNEKNIPTPSCIPSLSHSFLISSNPSLFSTVCSNEKYKQHSSYMFRQLCFHHGINIHKKLNIFICLFRAFVMTLSHWLRVCLVGGQIIFMENDFLWKIIFQGK